MRPADARIGLVALVALVALAGCIEDEETVPTCAVGSRLAIIAQSVPDAAYVPCITELPTGWSFRGVDVDDDGTTIHMESDRADRDVDVTLTSSCEIGSATPIAPTIEGARTYQRIDSIDPRYAGQFIDVFPGGCVVSSYDFQRGAHVALVTELQQAVALFSRRELRQELLDEFDIRLDP